MPFVEGTNSGTPATPQSPTARHISRRRLLTTSAATAGALLVGSSAATASASATEHTWPDLIPLPNGFRPEGITIGDGPYAYLGSLGDGSIYRADLRTGKGRIISAGPGTPSVGLKLDGRGRLFVAGRQGARVVDVRTGEIIASYTLTTKTPTFANDVFLTSRAAWFTDSFQPVLYALPLGGHGRLPGPDEVATVTLSGAWRQAPGEVVNANGITGTPDGKALLVVQSGAGGLHRVNPKTGVTELVDLGDAAPSPTATACCSSAGGSTSSRTARTRSTCSISPRTAAAAPSKAASRTPTSTSLRRSRPTRTASTCPTPASRRPRPRTRRTRWWQ